MGNAWKQDLAFIEHYMTQLENECNRYRKALEVYAEKERWIVAEGEWGKDQQARLWKCRIHGWTTAEQALKGSDE